MDSIRIDAGVKRIAINDDESRVIEFNPTDVEFAERFYALIGTMEAKSAEYQARADALGLETINKDGIPVNATAGMALTREACEDIHEQIDLLFGPGTSQTVFAGVLSMDMIHQFFEGLLPFFQAVREERIAKYQRPNGKRSRTMK